ncbi:hypothetical protein H5P28_13435 [Ruficoccus amylovorans]|uniref:Uncharacterized protein n=1 Tax=Ruficoccus amylovorans TaxID=1804625 RepID=A0A842HF73_9BACT|nr:hypothetical protein [Ruficoccus amylovorans]MBC2595265.1 hypothetical protein [Ruficoccus amylovorans]
MTNVSLQSTGADRLQAVARANARMGLLVALGELQASAGPDRRVTATSDMAGLGEDREHWTGVWNSESGDLVQWLVSNEGDFSGAGAGAGEGVVFFSNLEAAQQVRVPRVEMPDGDGGYAWWISDEGVKARVNVLDPYRELADVADSTDAEDAAAQDAAALRERYRLLVAQETGAALLLGADHTGQSVNPAVADEREFLERVLSLGQLELSPSGSDLFKADKLVHDVTLYSLGVLADASAGGLKRDLTAAFETGQSAPPGFPAAWWNRLRDYYGSAGNASLTARVDTDGQAQSYFPVLVKANFATTLFYGPAETVAEIPHWADGRKVYVGLCLSFSLHNPYNAELTLPEGFVAEVILPAEANPADDTSNAVNHFRVASAKARNGADRTEEELGTALDNGGLSRFYFRVEMDEAVTFAAGQTRLFSVDLNGADKDITGYTNDAIVAKLKPTVGDPDFLYTQAVLQEPDAADTYDGLYASKLGLGTDDQFSQVVFELDRNANLYVQLRVGLPGEDGGEPTWFSGFRSPLDLDGYASDDCRLEFIGTTFRPPGSSLSDGFGLSFEMPMSRRQSERGGFAVRPLVDFNMRAVPESWNDPATDYIEPDGFYRRVSTINQAAYTKVLTPLKWSFHDIYAQRTKQRATWAHSVFWIPAAKDDLSEEFGWAGPSPFGADTNGTGGSTSTMRDVDVGTVYFDVPAQKPYSLGALRHAGVSDSRYTPAYSVGSSWAPAFPASVDLGDEDDLFRLNNLLWDRYFFSSLTPEFQATLGSEQDWVKLPALPSSRLTVRTDNSLEAAQRRSLLTDAESAASQLMVKGSFNVNSTSEAAWRAVLASMRDALSDYRDDDTLAGTPFPRFSRTLLNNEAGAYLTGGGVFTTGSNDIHKGDEREYIYQGIRVLTDVEIENLAGNIVREIRRNGAFFGGPFLSMGGFVNRSLDEVDGEPATRLKGVLQLAIDDGPWAGEDEDAVLARWSGSDEALPAINVDVLKNDIVDNSVIGMDSMGLVGTAPANSYPEDFLALEPRSADAPAYLTQSDILAVLGPVLSVRSDTFVIRAYGDAVESLSAGGEPTVTAWCEAVVQRLPDPVERRGDDPLSADYYEPSDSTADTLGRRFVVLSFRWLSGNEI